MQLILGWFKLNDVYITEWSYHPLIEDKCQYPYKKERVYTYWLATPMKIVDTKVTIKVLLPEYQVYKCFIILNNCAIQNSKLGPFLMDCFNVINQCAPVYYASHASLVQSAPHHHLTLKSTIHGRWIAL
jgi:hypothetical protein